jgi:hypothetical protein
MKQLVAALALAGLTASPAAASVRDAAFAASSDHQQAQTSLFAGATYRINFDRRSGKPMARASLGIGGMMHSPGSSEMRIGQGLEIAGGKTGRPALFIAGREAGEIERRAGLSTGATIALAVVGVVVVAGAVTALLIDERLDRQNTE